MRSAPSAPSLVIRSSAQMLSAPLDDNASAALSEDRSAAFVRTRSSAGSVSLPHGTGAGSLIFAQVRVSSVTAFFAQRSSTMPLPSAAAAMRAAVAALLSARGTPLA